MRYRREEPFRFVFDEQIPARFSIIEANGRAVDTQEGAAKIVDLSLSGLKIESKLSIPLSSDNRVKISIRFKLNGFEYKLNGEIVWKKSYLHEFHYGIKLFSDENVQNELIKQLKNLSKLKKESKNDSHRPLFYREGVF